MGSIGVTCEIGKVDMDDVHGVLHDPLGIIGERILMKNVKTQVSDKKRKKEVSSEKSKAKKKKDDNSPPTLIPANLDDLINTPEDEPGSIENGDNAFEWMICPTKVSDFYENYWEKKPLLIKGSEDRNYYKSLFSTKALDKILREQRVLYGKNLDVTSYDGKRETHNPEGRVYPAVLWDFFNNGCSIRMLNPQTFHSQHWRLHKSRTKEEKLPRYSSQNFSQDEVGPPFMEMDLEPGDLLYLPRGTIHQGNCLEENHSLHITISMYQLNSWTDLLEKLLPGALAVASQENIEFRQGLPRDFLLNMGVVNEGKDTAGRKQFVDKAKTLMKKLIDYAPIDAACDQLGKKLMHDVLPPALELSEKARTVAGDGERWHSIKKTVVNRVEIDPDTAIRLVRSTAVRLVQEDDTVMLYYSTDNTREYHEVDSQCMEIGPDLAPALEHLITNYPEWSKVEQLPLDDLEERMKVAGDLWEKGIVITSEPLEPKYDDP